MGIDISSVVCQRPDQVSAEVDGEIVMMSVEHGSYFGLDPIASHIWTLIETPHRVDAICDVLMREFEVDRATCEADVLGFLEDLQAQELISVDAPSE